MCRTTKPTVEKPLTASSTSVSANVSKSTMRSDLKFSDGSVGPNVTVSFTVGGSGNNNNNKNSGGDKNNNNNDVAGPQ